MRSWATRLAELDRNTTMSLLAAVEAAFRIDYLQRCYQRKRIDVSRQFLEIYKEKESRASLEDDIFEVWKRTRPETRNLLVTCAVRSNFATGWRTADIGRQNSDKNMTTFLSIR